MSTATAPRPSTRRLGRGWYLAAVLSAVLAVGMCLLGWRQAVQADRISADPVRLQGVVTRLPTGSGTYSAVDYTVDGRSYTAADLALPQGAGIGDRVCLERAASDPAAVRACGTAYPQAAGVRLAQTTVPTALLVCLVSVVRIRRHRQVRSQGARIAAAFGAEAPTAPRRAHRRDGRRAAR